MIQIMAYDSDNNIVSKELSNFGTFNMSVVQDGDNYKLKLNSNYTYYDEFASEEAAVAKMAEITSSINNY